MHYSAEFVCPSVTLVHQDHIGWKPWKLIALSSSPTSSLFVAQRPSTYPYRKHGEIWWILELGVGKSGVLEHKSGNISETRKDRGKVTMECLQEVTNALSKGIIPDPLRPPLPRIWGLQLPSKTPMSIISGTGEVIFGLQYIHRVHPNKSP